MSMKDTFPLYTEQKDCLFLPFRVWIMPASILSSNTTAYSKTGGFRSLDQLFDKAYSVERVPWLHHLVVWYSHA